MSCAVIYNTEGTIQSVVITSTPEMLEAQEIPAQHARLDITPQLAEHLREDPTKFVVNTRKNPPEIIAR